VNNDGEISKIRKLYKDILKGYTKVYKKNSYIKHFREIDIGFVNEIKENFSKEAQEKGLSSEKEQIKILIEQEIWDEELEKQILTLQAQIANKNQTKSKLILSAQIEQVNKQLEKFEKELFELKEKRQDVLGLTREKYADRKSSEQLIRLAFYKDEKLKNLLFNKDEYEELEPIELNNLAKEYSEGIRGFSEKNLKKIACSTFFMNPFFLSKNDPVRFFGKPIIQLTNYQIDLFAIALGYKAILEKGQSPPKDLYNDLDKLVEWYESAGNLSKLSREQGGADGRTVVGAKRNELEHIAGTENTTDLIKEAQKRGGTMGMKDFIELHEGR
jgi:hypothetical protein